MTTDPQDDDTRGDNEDHLPVRSPQEGGLIDISGERLKQTIERGADVYFSACRRIAEFLNRNRDR